VTHPTSPRLARDSRAAWGSMDQAQRGRIMNGDLLNLLLASGWRDATDEYDDGERYVHDRRGLALCVNCQDDEDGQGEGEVCYALWDYDAEEVALRMLIWESYEVNSVIRWLS
jgi:hypothetical protein